MRMLLPFLVVLSVLATGCASTSSSGSAIAGDRSAVFTDVLREDAFDTERHISVEHTFTLKNISGRDVTIASGRATTDTVWRFDETGSATPPRTFAAGETVEVRMRGRLFRAEPRRFYGELTLETGEVVRLEMRVDS